MPEEKKQTYTVSSGNLKFNGKWYKPQTTIELTATEKKRILDILDANTHIGLAACKVS